jgi:hypothetical protein
MTGGKKEECSAMELDGLVKIRQDAPLTESVAKTDGKIVERRRLIRMTRGAKE